MIISCPACATRYDVDDERFSPSGRSVRCTACGEAWFVPAPELLDVEPIEDLTVEKRAAPRKPAAKGQRPVKAKSFPQSGQGRAHKPAAPVETKPHYPADDDAYDYEEEDDSLFGAPQLSESDQDFGNGVEAEVDFDDHDEGPRLRFPFGGRRKSSNKKNLDDDDDRSGRTESANEPPFLKHREKALSAKQNGGAQKRAVDASYEVIGPDDDQFADISMNEALVKEKLASEKFASEKAVSDKLANEKEDQIGGDRRQGFGRRASDRTFDANEDRQGLDGRAPGTEIARLEDVSPFDPEEFDEEFFRTLKATPEDLARALSKTRRRAEVRRKNRLTPLRALGWLVWLGAVAGVCYGVYNFRNEIVKIAPKTADAYAVIGIDADPYGLAIENVQHRLAMSTNGATIEISGKLRNNGNGAIDAPLLQAEALGQKGELLSRWTFAPNETQVLEGATIDFITRAPAPEGVAEVALSFAPAKSPVSDLFPGLQ